MLPALLVALVLWTPLGSDDVGRSGQRVLPWLLACLGSGLALMYNQVRTLCLLLLAAAVLTVLHPDLAHFLRLG